MSQKEQLNISVRAMQSQDISSVVAIHIEQFPDSRSTGLGKIYLRKMYLWFIDNQPGLAFVVVNSEKIIGFVTGAIGGYGRKIFRYAFFEIVFGLILHPSTLFRHNTFSLWTSYLKGLAPKHQSIHRTQNVSNYSQIIKASLSSIAVRKEYQGQGFGKVLLAAFEKGAALQGASLLGLSVDKDNIPACNLYTNCGWRIDREDHTQNSVYFTKQI